MTGTCRTCGAALARCDWCGETDPVTDGTTTCPVVPSSDPLGNYHDPCRRAELETVRKARPA